MNAKVENSSDPSNSSLVEEEEEHGVDYIAQATDDEKAPGYENLEDDEEEEKKPDPTPKVKVN